MDATVICNDKHQYAVIDGQGNTIVPFGTYEWIENFNRGYARVKSFILRLSFSGITLFKYDM